MELEHRGIPTVVVCTDVFIGLAREESRNLGMPDLPIAVIPHPLGGLTPDLVQHRSVEALEQVIHGLTHNPR